MIGMKEEDFRKEAIKIAAYLMAVSARTAPKGKGEDYLEILFVDGDEKERIAQKMEELAGSRGQNFIRDANGVRKAEGVLLIGVDGGEPLMLNCGACGFTCKEMPSARKEGRDFVGPNCVFRVLDMGIAIGSAVKLGSIFGVDSRVMYRIGVAARMLGIAKADVVMGIPLASLGKNPFFDR